MTEATSAQKKRNRGLKGWVITVGMLLLAALVALVLALSGMLSIPGITQSQGELVLQGADEQGLDAFSATALASPAAATTPEPVAVPVTTGVAGASLSGASVGLYGGTGDISRCDPAQLVSFLGANPAKAQAFVAALNADPNLRWKNNDKLTTADIPAYTSQLTSLVLLKDTRVTNHGYSNGNAKPFQAVLQAGTAVLVDRFGVPRTRCMCGNPLLPPAALASTPKVTGTQWPGFSIDTTITIVQTQTTVNVFSAVPYPNGGTLIDIPAGVCDPADPASCASPWTAAPAPVPPTPTETAAPVDPATVPETPPVTQQCSQSTESAPSVQLTVTNNSNIPVDLWWISSDCTPSFSVRILPGETTGEGMGYEGDSYVLTSGDAVPLAEFKLPAGSLHYVFP